MLKALPDLHVVVEEVLSEGDIVAARWLVSGTHAGEYRGRRGAGQLVRLRGTTWVRSRTAMFGTASICRRPW